MAELDRFCDAMPAIHEKIRAVEEGSVDKADNLLKNHRIRWWKSAAPTGSTLTPASRRPSRSPYSGAQVLACREALQAI